MNPNIFLPSSFYARHIESGAVRRVVAIRCQADGSRCFQFSQCVKHNGETFYWADSTECVS